MNFVRKQKPKDDVGKSFFFCRKSGDNHDITLFCCQTARVFLRNRGLKKYKKQGFNKKMVNYWRVDHSLELPSGEKL